MAEHRLKTWPREFEAVLQGLKRFEFRKDDRGGFNVGDVLLLQEWVPVTTEYPTHEGKYTGRELRAHVTYVLQGLPYGGVFGLQEGHVVMSILPDVLGG